MLLQFAFVITSRIILIRLFPSSADRKSTRPELQSHHDLVCRLLLEKKKKTNEKKKKTQIQKKKTKTRKLILQTTNYANKLK